MSNQTNTPTMAPPDSGVKVRMYRPRGLGDCFLLAFRDGDGSGRYMLIDCGIFFATKGGSARMKKIARDIAAATGGQLHVLVATHEHWDHLSGFQFAEKIFDGINVEQVWLAWTEDRHHPLAKRLREKHAVALRALTTAVARLQAADDPGARTIQEVLDFHGGFDTILGISGTAGQMAYVHDRVSEPHYCRPEEAPLTLPEVPGVRVFVLGPPENEDLLSRSNPSKVDSEVYERALALDEASAFYVAALAAEDPNALSVDETELLEQSFPFDRSRCIPLDEAQHHEQFGTFFQRRYGFASEEGHGPAWRRIQTAWLGAAGSLALQLDNDTNNTSLTLAIELTESGRVLLFAADAQVGNWLSWHQTSWPDAGPGGAEVTGSDLVQRTVLYKVGHHGSHNATLRELGLEQMQSPALVAMIPVDDKQAAQKEWAMPFPPLLERLQEKTAGRIIRADEGIPKKPDEVSQDAWDDFLARTALDPGPDELWVEYTVA